jgi:hypothetical protein
MKTIAQELNLFRAIDDNLCIEVPKEQLVSNQLSKAFYEKNDPNVFVFIEQTEKELKLVYSLDGEKYQASEELIILKVGNYFLLRKCTTFKDFSDTSFHAEILKDKLYEEILPSFYKAVQMYVDYENEIAEDVAKKDAKALDDEYWHSIKL